MNQTKKRKNNKRQIVAGIIAIVIVITMILPMVVGALV